MHYDIITKIEKLFNQAKCLQILKMKTLQVQSIMCMIYFNFLTVYFFLFFLSVFVLFQSLKQRMHKIKECIYNSGILMGET